MTAENRFKSVLINWLCSQNMSNIDINFAEDFGYTTDDDLGIHILNIGVIANNEGCNYFEQFLYEYGCEYLGIPYPILAFLHECGHINTLNQFSPSELYLYQITKQFSHDENPYEWYTNYWLLPDEFAANIWVINFINTHIDEVEQLCDIFIHEWIKLRATVNSMLDLIKEN